jgi:hypothetical protein
VPGKHSAAHESDTAAAGRWRQLMCIEHNKTNHDVHVPCNSITRRSTITTHAACGSLQVKCCMLAVHLAQQREAHTHVRNTSSAMRSNRHSSPHNAMGQKRNTRHMTPCSPTKIPTHCGVLCGGAIPLYPRAGYCHQPTDSKQLPLGLQQICMPV